ncbi:tolB protein precursor protein, partial [Corallococcus sp. 4LFB]
MNPRPHVIAVLLALLLPELALAQVFVVPRRAGKTPVNSYEFEWRHIDILVGPAATGMAKPADHTAHEQPPGTQGGANPNAPTTSPQTGDTQSPPGGPEVTPSGNVPTQVSGDRMPATDGVSLDMGASDAGAPAGRRGPSRRRHPAPG